MKQQCAKKAVELIKQGMIVGLGGGSTVGFLIQEIESSNLRIQAVTPSMDTEGLCRKHHIPVLPLESVSAIDIAFDGCDELDDQLNALKSCGGIHTREKIVAAMAKDYVLLADEEKQKERLTFSYPVTVEVVRSGRAFVKTRLEALGAVVTERRSSGKSGLTITDDGHYLMEAKFERVEDLEQLATELDAIPGLLEHSLFNGIATKALIAAKDEIYLIERKYE